MATTPTLSGLELTKWRSKFITEYIRDTGFDTYMGDADTDIIHVVNDLQTDGYTIRIPGNTDQAAVRCRSTRCCR